MSNEQLAILLRKYEKMLWQAVYAVADQLPDSLKEGHPSGNGADDPYPVVLDPIISVAAQLGEDADLLAPKED